MIPSVRRRFAKGHQYEDNHNIYDDDATYDSSQNHKSRQFRWSERLRSFYSPVGLGRRVVFLLVVLAFCWLPAFSPRGLRGGRYPLFFTKALTGRDPIDHIYYINLNQSTDRREQMEAWLSKLHRPYERVEAQIPPPGNFTCIPSKSEHRGQCKGTAGLALSNLHIWRHFNTTGVTLVLEDDYQIDEWWRLQEFLQDEQQMQAYNISATDWDTIRFNCWDILSPEKQATAIGRVERVHEKVLRTRPTVNNYKGVSFFGGTHVTLWHERAVPKLIKAWSRQPFDDIDVRLWTNDMMNFCVDFGKTFGHSLRVSSTIPRKPKNVTKKRNRAIWPFRLFKNLKEKLM